MKISFDFDNTLTQQIVSRCPETGDIVSDTIIPNLAVVNIMREFDARGHEIFIITSRMMRDESLEEVNVFLWASGLAHLIRNVFFTNFEPKKETIEGLGIDMHFDDDEEEFNGLNILTVKVPLHESWRIVANNGCNSAS